MIEPGQQDPAWRFIQLLGYLGLASNIGVPRAQSLREDLQKNSFNLTHSNHHEKQP